MQNKTATKPRVLIVGHNVFDRRTASGKTLISFFKDWGSDRLAQLYFHSEVPTCAICDHYYRITDVEVLKNVIVRRAVKGKEFGAVDIDEKRSSSRTDKGIKKKLYSFGRKRSSLIYIGRNFIWKHAKWYTDDLKKWIADFAPEVIFFAAGDYSFAYDITCKIASEFNIPVITYCCDDFFINRPNPRSLLGKLVHKSLMRSVYRCVEKSSSVITICDKMTEEYKKLFSKPVYTVHTGYSAKGEPCENKTLSAVYLGKLEYNRYESLIDVGKALKSISEEVGKDYVLDVYSSESSPAILKKLNVDNGIVFHGAVDAEDVKKIISESTLVLHVESFRKRNIQKVQYSVSTKIADMLASEVCIFAYGPQKIASMEYLAENSAAIVVNDKAKLKAELANALCNENYRSGFIRSASDLAEKNHKPDVVSGEIADIILSAI